MGSNYYFERDSQGTGSTGDFPVDRDNLQTKDTSDSYGHKQPPYDNNHDYSNRGNSPGQVPEDASAKTVIPIVLGLMLALTLVAAVLGGVISGKSRLGDGQKEIRPDGPVEISDSWEEIAAASDDGTYKKKYHIGDTKELDLGEEGIITMKLVAMDTDELAYDSGYAPMTWIAEELLNTEQCMNPEDSIAGGWSASYMRDWLRDDILPLFPEDVRGHIKMVYKYSFDPEIGTVSSPDTLWIPSAREIYGSEYSDEEEGPEYTEVFDSAETWKKYHIEESDPSLWYLRSALIFEDGDEGFIEGSDGGLYSHSGTTSSFYLLARVELGVLIGFCL